MNAIGVLLQSPLVRNGYALVASAGVTSVLGLVFWMIAARLFSEQQLGLGAVLVSTLVTLSSISQLNFNNVLNRFVPVAGSRAGTLILSAYAMSVAAGMALSAAFLLSVRPLIPDLAFLVGEPLLAACFMAAVAAWTLFALQDSALSSLRQSQWVPLENAVYSLAKIGMLAWLAGSVGSGLGILAAWTAPLVPIVVAVNILIFYRLLPRHQKVPVPQAMSPRALARYFGWDYLGGLSLTAAMGIAPLLVLSHAGPAGSANYHLAWTITYSLYLIGRSMGISLLAEGSFDPNRMPVLVSDTLVHTMLPLAGAALLIATGAPLLMSLFGESYAREGATLLSILALSSIPWGMVTIFLATARARGWLRAIAGTQAATLCLALGIGALLLPAMGAVGMGLAWLAAHTLVLLGIIATCVYAGGRTAAISFLLELASAVARLRQLIVRPRQVRPDQSVMQAVRKVMGEAGEHGDVDWLPVGGRASLSDSSVLFLHAAGVRDPVPQVVLKQASSTEGMASMGRGRARLEALRSDGRLASMHHLLPRSFGQHRHTNSLVELEAAVAGEDGRDILGATRSRAAALRAAALAIEQMHRLTAEVTTIDASWLHRWVDQPLALLEGVSPRLLASSGAGGAAGAFREQQHQFWTGRRLALGVGHGDFSPGNILFRTGAGQASEVEVAAIIDWDCSEPDAPGAVDTCHLALTTRMLVRGSELGTVVAELLADPRWEADELAWLADDDATGWPRDGAAVRAIVGLAWLHHVAANLQKSRRYSQSRLWLIRNVGWVWRAYAGSATR